MTEQEKQEVFDYLDALRESGAINMFGASTYVAEQFDVSSKEARALTVEWMTNFGKRG